MLFLIVLDLIRSVRLPFYDFLSPSFVLIVGSLFTRIQESLIANSSLVAWAAIFVVVAQEHFAHMRGNSRAAADGKLDTKSRDICNRCLSLNVEMEKNTVKQFFYITM